MMHFPSETLSMCEDEGNTADIGDELGFLWMCGACESKPTYITIYDLFAHKKEEHGTQRAVLKGDFFPKNDDDRVENNVIVGEPNHSNTASDDDVPLSQLKRKSELLSLNVEDKEYCHSPTNEGDRNSNTVAGGLIKESLKLVDLEQHTQNAYQQSDQQDNNIVENAADNVSEDNNEIEDDFNIRESDEIDLHSLNSKRDADDYRQSGQHDDNSVENDADNVAEDDNEIEDDFNIREPDEVDLHNLNNKRDADDSHNRHFCKICCMGFTSRRSLSKHKSIHLCPDTRMFKCDTCGKLSAKYDNFTRHLAIHQENRKKTFSCENCLSSFYNVADLKRHRALHLEVKPYTCEHCGEGFMKEYTLLIHMAKHTGVQYAKFTCKLCGKILNSPSALAMHSKNHTTKTVFCTEQDCQFSCSLQSQLRQHMRKHNGEKPFQCSVCGRCFARSNDMKNHILNVHEQVRPFKCGECPKQFTLMSSLKSHRLIHLDIRPYLCDECGKRFNHPSTLRKHTHLLHRNIIFNNSSVKKQKHKQSTSKVKIEEHNSIEVEEVVKREVTYADAGVQSQSITVVPFPIQIPQMTVNLEQGFTQTYIIPTVAIPSTHIIKPESH